MRSLNKFEATGIFVSIVVMALALSILHGRTSSGITAPDVSTQQGAVVVAAKASTSSGETTLRNALTDAADLSGSIQKLVIDDVKIGTGTRAVADGDTVTVNYIGSTKDGVQFDSSYKRGTPFTFTVGAGKVIEGWEKGLIGMKVGGQRILVIPSSMGYGKMQVGSIPPNSTLVFAVELLKIQ